MKEIYECAVVVLCKCELNSLPHIGALNTLESYEGPEFEAAQYCYHNNIITITFCQANHLYNPCSLYMTMCDCYYCGSPVAWCVWFCRLSLCRKVWTGVPLSSRPFSALTSTNKVHTCIVHVLEYTTVSWLCCCVHVHVHVHLYVYMYVYQGLMITCVFQTKNKFILILPLLFLLVGDEMKGAQAKGKLAEKLTKPKKSKSTNNKASQKSTKVQLSSHHFILLCTCRLVTLLAIT